MNRREFITRSITTLPFLSVAYISPADQVLAMQHNVIQSFAGQSATGKKQLVAYCEIANCVKSENNQLSIRIKSEVVHNTDKEYDPNMLFSKDLPFLDTIERKYNTKEYNVCNVIRAANRIAVTTRRGRGNRFAQFPDYVLIWYQGYYPYDAPIQRVGRNIFLHPDYKSFFIKIDGMYLTDNDINALEYNGLKRII